MAKQQERLVDRLQEEDLPSGEENDEIEEDSDDELLAGQIELTSAEKEMLVLLKRSLQEKKEFLWQLQQQETAFLGGDDSEGVRGSEFVGTLSQDYTLVPGRPTTRLPEGTSVVLFGQLPNGKWRCAALNEDCDSHESPMMGCVPECVIKEFSTLAVDCRLQAMKIGRALNTADDHPASSCSLSSDSSESGDIDVNESSHLLLSPYSNHRPNRKGRSSEVQTDSKLRPVSADSSPSSSATERHDTPTMLRSNANDIVIKRHLRQVGISIILGSSSSEEEVEESSADCIQTSTESDDQSIDDNGLASNDGWIVSVVKSIEDSGISQDLSQKADDIESDGSVVSSSDDSAGDESHAADSNETFLKADHKTQVLPMNSSSPTTTNSVTLPALRVTTDTDLLFEYGSGQSATAPQETDHRRRLSSSDQGSSVHPPRNINRTLRLCKQSSAGYGFTLETFVFLNSTGENESQTLVRSVEEDGPAFNAGLRPGDVLLEVDGKTVVGTDHWDLVKDISDAEDQLLLVVKFLDAIRHTELTMKLYERQAKVKAKFAEYEALCKREKEFMIEGTDELEDSLIDMQDDLYTETGLLSAPDNVVIKTSRFDAKLSSVTHGVKEIKCDESLTISRRGVPIPQFTTDYDLLEMYASNDEKTFRSIFLRLASSIKRSASMPDTRIDFVTNRYDGRARTSIDGHPPMPLGSYRAKTNSDVGPLPHSKRSVLSAAAHQIGSQTNSLQRGLRAKSYKLALGDKIK